MNAAILLLLFISAVCFSTQGAQGYEYAYGCYYGYCWAGCHAIWGASVVGALSGRRSGEWCYTKESYDYVKCESMSDCSNEWKCAGPCSIG